MRDPFYDSHEWRSFSERICDRDGNRCTVARLLGGRCSGVLHVHHIEPRSERPDLSFDEDNCGTACARHHPIWERLRRALVHERGRDDRIVRCRHRHPTVEGRRECERRRARDLGIPLERVA